MDRHSIVFLFAYLLVFGLVREGLDYCVGNEPTQQPCEYCATVLERLPTESTPGFFERIHVTVKDLNVRYTVYAFLPVFDTYTPTVIGAIIVYEVKR